MEETSALIAGLEAYSYWGVMGVALIANVFPGIPEEIFILTLGYLTGIGIFNFWLTALLLYAGLFLSDIIIFYLASSGNKYLAFFQKTFWRAETFFNHEERVRKHFAKIMFVTRFIPYFRFVGPGIGGMLHIPWKKFLKINAVALAVYVPVILFIGNYFQDRIAKILEGANQINNILLIAIIVIIIFALQKRLQIWIKRFVDKANNGESFFNQSIVISEPEDAE